MKLLLVNPPNGLLDRTDLAPPLGLLTLAAVAREHSHEVFIRDFNLDVIADTELGDEEFYDYAVAAITATEADVIGFTSMCVESHVSLELARRIKDKSPDVFTVLGGTHFGAIAHEVMTLFPFVDFVVSGEGEHALTSILEFLQKKAGALPKNVFYRHRGVITTGSDEVCRFALEDLPFPAYDLIDLQKYFALNPRRVFNYEAGRGCVFSCAFCYSPAHYGKAVRNKRPEIVVEDLRGLEQLGAEHIFFVQDNLLNSPKWASELCEQIAGASLSLTWNCYVTYPQLNEQIIDLMSKSGCVGVFTGIDAVTHDSQIRMGKKFLRNWQAVREKLSYCVERNVIPTCAFILEEPDQDSSRLEATMHAAVECKQLGCEVHINTLSIYNGSLLSRKESKSRYSYTSAKPELLLDTPKVVQENEFAKLWPELFPYHSTPCQPEEWEAFIGKAHTLFALTYAFPRTLFSYVIEEGNSVWDLLGYVDHDFTCWLRGRRAEERRAAAVVKFCERFASERLTDKTGRLFLRELARFLLSGHDTPRRVQVLTHGPSSDYYLGWFINLSTAGALTRSAGSSAAKLYRKIAGKLLEVVINEPVRYEYALLTRGRTVKLMSVSGDKALVLCSLEEAADSNQLLSIGYEKVERLEKEGWIWATNNGPLVSEEENAVLAETIRHYAFTTT